MAAELRARIDAAERRQVPDLLAFLREAPRPLGPLLSAERTAELDLAELPAFAAPSNAVGRERLRARLRSLRR